MKIWYVLVNCCQLYVKVLQVITMTRLLCQLHFNYILNSLLWFHSDAFARILLLQDLWKKLF